MIDDERGPCGSADASRGERTVSEDEEGPFEVELKCLRVQARHSGV